MSGDDRDDERPRRSWAEIDRLRDGARPRSAPREPRSAAERERAGNATRAYLSRLDRTLFARGAARGEAERLGRAVVEALGSPALDEACRAYLDGAGPPREAHVLAAFLDARDPGLRVAGLRALAAAVREGLVPTAGLRAQVRMLADDLDDAIAEAAEDVLAAL